MSKYTPATFQPTVRPDWAGILSYLSDKEKSEILTALFKYPSDVSEKCESAFWKETIKPDLDLQYQVFTESCKAKSRGVRNRWGKISIRDVEDKDKISITYDIDTEREREEKSEDKKFVDFTVALDETVDDTINETANATANATANDVSPRDTEYIENKEYVEINNNNKNNQNEKINKMLNKIGKIPNSILIDDSFKCSDYPIFAPYIKEMPPEIIADVQKWIIKTKKGQSINQDFVSKLFIKFAQRQGKPIFKQGGTAK